MDSVLNAGDSGFLWISFCTVFKFFIFTKYAMDTSITFFEAWASAPLPSNHTFIRVPIWFYVRYFTIMWGISPSCEVINHYARYFKTKWLNIEFHNVLNKYKVISPCILNFTMKEWIMNSHCFTDIPYFTCSACSRFKWLKVISGLLSNKKRTNHKWYNFLKLKSYLMIYKLQICCKRNVQPYFGTLQVSLCLDKKDHHSMDYLTMCVNNQIGPFHTRWDELCH